VSFPPVPSSLCPEEIETQQHPNFWSEAESMIAELLRKREWGVGYDTFPRSKILEKVVT
jgi:hypothetical protein